MIKIARTARHRKNRFGIRAALASSAAILAGILLAVAGTAGSYALWNSSAPIADANISSGTLSITVKYGTGAAGSTASIPNTAWTGMLPGDFVGQEITVANTGNVVANMSARLTATTPYEIRLAPGNCPATQLTSAPLGTSPVGYGSMPAGVSSVACVQVALPTTAAAGLQGNSSSFTIQITGAQ